MTRKKQREVIEIRPADRIIVHLHGEIEMRGDAFDIETVDEVLQRMREYGSAEIAKITVERCDDDTGAC